MLIALSFKNPVLSFGLPGGRKLYSANYSELNPYQQYDPNSYKHILKMSSCPILERASIGRRIGFYAGFSVPNLLEGIIMTK